ncbi:unnamed protein product [Closterium sp. NIES-54]
MLALCREHILEHRTKQIALRYFLALELQQRGQLRLAYVASQANTADIFTKALPPGDHQRFCTMLDCVVFLLEVKQAVKRMAKNKTPSSDGLPKELFEAQWNVLGKRFMGLALDFESSASLLVSIEEVVTMLLYKKGDEGQLYYYYLITLFYFSWKVLAWVVA